MYFARIAIETPDGPQARVVVASSDAPERWIDARAAERLRLLRRGATSTGAARLAAALVPGSLSAALEGGAAFIEAAQAAAQSPDEAARAPPGARELASIDAVAYRALEPSDHSSPLILAVIASESGSESSVTIRGPTADAKCLPFDGPRPAVRSGRSGPG